MAALKSGFPLMGNERLVLEVESTLYMTSPWFLLRFMWGMIRPIFQILGFKRTGYLIVTDKRIVELYVQKVFWLIDFRKCASSISLKKIRGDVEYVKKGRFMFFARAYQVFYDKSLWVRTYFSLGSLEENEAQKIVSLIGQVVTSEQQVTNLY